MSWVSKLKKAARKVKKAVNKAADRIADAVETAGNKAQDACKKLAGDIKNNVPGVVGKALGALVGWAGGVVSGVMDLAGAAIKGIGSIIGGSLAGLLNILAGDFKNGFREILTGFVGGVLIVVGKFVSLVQSVFGLEGRKRALTEKEVAMLKNVFRNSVALFNVRIIKGKSGVFSFTDRAFTMGNSIYMKDTVDAEWNNTLVHETTHVWQYQNWGSSYSSDALGAQTYYEHVKNASAYDWTDSRVNGGHMVWVDWNRESQAQFIENVWTDGELATAGGGWTKGNGAFYSATGSIAVRFEFKGTNYTPVAQQAVIDLRSEVTVRPSLADM